MKWIGQVVHGVKTNFSNDGEIYVIADDLYIENVTQDKDIIFKTNNGGTATEVMRIDGSTSNIGIGTSSPAYTLDVAGVINTNSNYRQGGVKILGRESSNTVLEAGGDNDIVFETNDAEKVRVLSSGNVGIGTTSPSEKLHVSGNARIEGNLTVNGTYTQIDTDTSTTEQWLVTNDGTGPAAVINQKGSQDIFDVQDDGTSVFYIEDGGNVGIGTTSPLGILHTKKTASGIVGITIQNGSEFENNGAAVYFKVAGSSSDYRKGGILFVNNGTGYGRGDLYFSLNTSTSSSGIADVSSAKMTIKDSGNVGIGTTSPSVGLQLGNNSPGQTKLAIFNSEGGNENGLTIQSRVNRARIKVADNDTSAYMVAEGSIASFGMADSAAATNISVLSSGNVGIGKTNPAHKLDVAGGAQFNTTTGATPFYVTRSGAIDQALSIKVMDDNVRFESIQDETADNYGGFDFRMDGGTTEPDFVIRKNAGNPIFNVKGDGNVGIGTTSPDNILHIIKDQGGVASALKLENKAGADNSGFDIDFQLASSGLSAKIGAVRTNSDGAGDTDMFFSTSTNGSTATEAMRITHDGNVGIGTTSPTTTLEVKKVGSTADAGIRIDAGRSADFFIDRGTTSSRGVIDFLTASSRKWRVGNAASGTDDFQIFGANSNEFIIDRDTGNVGIGTTSPDEKLEVDGRIKLQTTAGSLVAQEFGAGSVKLTSSATLGVEAPSNFRVKTGPSLNENFTVLSTGNVGIGTTSPASLLHVAGTVQVGVDDTGHDVTFYSDTAGKKMLWQSSTNQLKLSDNVYLSLGDSGDLYARHTGGYGDISNNTGYFYIRNNANDSDIVFQADDGSGGVATYFYLDGSQATGGGTLFTKWGDNSYISLGDGSDLYFFHNGTDSKMQNSTGDLLFENYADDKDIIFTCDDGSGGVTAYLTLDGSEGYTVANKNIRFQDNVEARFGSGNDMKLFHTGAYSMIQNLTGDLFIQNVADDKDIIFQSDDGSGSVETYFFLDGSSADANYNYTVFPDLSVAAFGNDKDLRLFHSSTNSYIQNLVGDLYIQNQANDKDIILLSDDGSGGHTAYLTLDGSAGTLEAAVPFNNTHAITSGGTITADTYFQSSDTSAVLASQNNGSVFLRPNGIGSGTGAFSVSSAGKATVSGELEATSLDINGNADISGTLTVGVDDTGHDVKFYGATSGKYVEWDESSDCLRLADNTLVKFGYGNDLVIYHDGSNNHITADNGDLTFTVNENDHDIIFKSDDGSGGVTPYLTLDGGLGYTTVQKNMRFDDNAKANFGNSGDLYVYHDATQSYIYNYTGDLKIINAANDKDIIFQSDDGSGGTTEYFRLDGSSTQTIFSKNQQHADNVTTYYGNAGDLSIYHDGSNSYIKHVSGASGDLIIEQSVDDADIIFKSDDGSGGVKTYFYLDGSIGATIVPDSTSLGFGTGGDMYISHDTTNTHITNFTGDLYITNRADDKDVILRSDDGSGGHTAYLTLDGSEGHLTVQKEMNFADSVEATFGASNDLKVYHSGSHSYMIQRGTGNLYIQQTTNDADIVFTCDDGSGGNATYLTLDGSLGFTTIQKHVRWEDGIIARFGNSDDGSLYHSGGHFYMGNNTGDIIVTNTTDDGDIHLPVR